MVMCSRLWRYLVEQPSSGGIPEKEDAASCCSSQKVHTGLMLQDLQLFVYLTQRISDVLHKTFPLSAAVRLVISCSGATSQDLWLSWGKHCCEHCCAPLFQKIKFTPLYSMF